MTEMANPVQICVLGFPAEQWNGQVGGLQREGLAQKAPRSQPACPDPCLLLRPPPSMMPWALRLAQGHPPSQPALKTAADPV